MTCQQLKRALRLSLYESLLSSHTLKYKRPRHIIILPPGSSLPRNKSGKLVKRRVVTEFWRPAIHGYDLGMDIGMGVSV